MAFLLPGCSGLQSFAVARTDGGDFEVLSKCSNRGFSTIQIRGSAPDELLLWLQYAGEPGRAPNRLVLAPAIADYKTVESSAALPTDDQAVSIYADYDDPTLIGGTILIRPSEIDSAMVAVSTTDGDGPSFELMSRVDFEKSVGSCGIGRLLKPTIVVFAAIGLLTVVILGVRRLRSPRRGQVPGRSSLDV